MKQLKASRRPLRVARESVSGGSESGQMRLLRRRTKAELAPPVVLPSLDRLAGLIERVVELVDEVAGAPSGDSKRPARACRTACAPAPPQVLEPAAPPSAASRRPPSRRTLPRSRGGSPSSRRRRGTRSSRARDLCPSPGDVLELDGAAFRVLRYAPSPLPGDRRRCAVVVEGGTAGAGAKLRRVKEESQIDEMRAALRGDRERAEQSRQRSTENVLGLVEPRADEPVAEAQPEPAPRRGLLGRLFGR